MPKSLVVVESPAKARTINKYLGRDYTVEASMGHVKDLPKSKLGVDIKRGFKPEYEVIPARKKVLKALKDAARGAKAIYVATDPDREGEAIGKHLADELGGRNRPVHRVMFNEITKNAIRAAFAHPGKIDERMVDAQQARRVLDRLVGYKISPLLWEKVRRGLSAGRVQSVALKLVCDREREIERFVPEEYWHVFANLSAALPPAFDAKLAKRADAPVAVKTGEEAQTIVAALERERFVVSSIVTKERRKSPLPPFTTSKLQQEASRRLRLPVKRTMMIAQQLYEGVELPGEGGVGLITYMRTDSTRVADQALQEVRQHIADRFGSDYLPEKPAYYRAKADAQDAHEAIRPTSTSYDPEAIRSHLTREQYALYRLIWNRFVASQMTPALFDDTTVDIRAGEFLFRAKGSVPRFSGYLAVYEETREEAEGGAPGTPEPEEETPPAGPINLPPMAEGDVLTLNQLRPEQKFTQPPPRFTEATLVKELEDNGIGRPSTYASILSTIQNREYVSKEEGKFRPTAQGFLVTDLLQASFDDILAVEYTAKMEEQLDEIEQGQANYLNTLQSFYEKFRADLERAHIEMPDIKREGQATDIVCEKCGAPMVIKAGRFGPFLACSAYPECKNTRELDRSDNGADATTEVCENCGRPMVIKKGRYGRFLACSGYPECKTTRRLVMTKDGVVQSRPDVVLDETCPRCGSNLVLKHGQYGEFTACSKYPECRYVKLKSTGVPCPKPNCGGDIVERKTRRGRVFYGCSRYPDCDFTLWNRPIAEACPSCGATYLVEKITKREGRVVFCQNQECDYKRTEELQVVEG